MCSKECSRVLLGIDHISIQCLAHTKIPDSQKQVFSIIHISFVELMQSTIFIKEWESSWKLAPQHQPKVNHTPTFQKVVNLWLDVSSLLHTLKRIHLAIFSVEGS